MSTSTQREDWEIDKIDREMPRPVEEADGEAFAASCLSDMERRLSRILRRLQAMPPNRCVWIVRRAVEPVLRNLERLLTKVENAPADPDKLDVLACRSELCSNAVSEWLHAVAVDASTRNHQGEGLPIRIAVEWMRAEVSKAVSESFGGIANLLARCDACHWRGLTVETLIEGLAGPNRAIILCPRCGRADRMRYAAKLSEQATV